MKEKDMKEDSISEFTLQMNQYKILNLLQWSDIQISIFRYLHPPTTTKAKTPLSKLIW